MSRAQRDSDIGIVCSRHGLQAGRTRCRWCGEDPIKIYRSSLRLDAGLPRAGLYPGDGVSFEQEQNQVMGDRLR